MKKFVAVGVIGLVLGGVVGAMVQQRATRQRQHVLAVMWLSQYHLQSLQEAVTKGDCAVAAQSASRLQGLASELALALPLANAQDATFHGYIEQLKSSAAPGVAAPGQCAYDAALLKRVRESCADCHRDYR
jgi:hypothetical protein